MREHKDIHKVGTTEFYAVVVHEIPEGYDPDTGEAWYGMKREVVRRFLTTTLAKAERWLKLNLKLEVQLHKGEECLVDGDIRSVEYGESVFWDEHLNDYVRWLDDTWSDSLRFGQAWWQDGRPKSEVNAG